MAAADPISHYWSKVQTELRTNKATEHTYRPALKDLIEALGKDILAVNEPKRIECGAPDYTVARQRKHGNLTLGYIEAKDLGVDLDATLKTDQLKRYLKSLDNLILTDYIEFRWFVEGKHRMTSSLTQGEGGKGVLDDGGAKVVRELLEGFLAHETKGIRSAKDLAERLAKLTHMIRDIIVDAFRKKKISDALHDMRRAMQQALIPNMSDEEFADMFSQTIAYGLFAARANHDIRKGRFERRDAAAEIPKTNPLLRNLFKFISSNDLEDEPYAGFVDDLTQLLADTDMEGVLADFGKRTRQEDPVVHFYETFLAAYDPKLRESRGVYYTPSPVVSYIVRSVDYLLKEKFGVKDGLSDTSTVTYKVEEGKGKKKVAHEKTAPKVLILDPACGTGTFLYHTVDHIRRGFMEKGNAGMWSGYVKDHILPRIFGFELLMAPYAVAHLKLGMQLAGQDLPEKQREKWAYDFKPKERLGVFLTNTLEEAERRAQIEFGFLQSLSEESNEAAKIKSELPIMVVMGNPPYSGHSANKGEWIGKLLRDYYQVDGKPLGEKNPKWLQDDYVKFIRFSQWRIEQTGAGILAFITNHGYLDNPTFRGMRQSLMKTFDEIYLLDLHGSSKKKEDVPQGISDKNVFDIQQGVGIGIFIKHGGDTERVLTRYAEVWGERQTKYDWLLGADIKSTSWNQLKPQAPHYLFIPRDADLAVEYENEWRITEIMTLSAVGVVTARDSLTIQWSQDLMWDVISDFVKLDTEDARQKYDLREDVRDWKVEFAKADLTHTGPHKSYLTQIHYRPFDFRWTYYTGTSRGFQCMPRPEVMPNMIRGTNLGLISARSNKSKVQDQFFCSKYITEAKTGESTTQSCLFPLYLYPETELDKRGSKSKAAGQRSANLNPDFIKDVEKKLKLSFVPDGKGDLKSTFGPEDVFNYIYAIFHSPTYRKRYAEFLKIDFPRVPLTSDRKLFAKLCGLGGKLVALHLMEEYGPDMVSFPEKGSDEVDKIRYTEPGEGAKKGRVWINKTQYFEGVPPEVWEFHVGGYQVCYKWLKDRKGRTLSHEDKQHYMRIVSALSETIRLMAEVNKAIPRWPVE